VCLTPDSNRNRAVSRKHPRLPAKRDVEVCWLYTSYVSGRSRHSLATYASCQIVHRATFNIFIAQQLYIVAVAYICWVQLRIIRSWITKRLNTT